MWFKRMEEDVLQQWCDWRETSWKKYQETYDKLNTMFDVALYSGGNNVNSELKQGPCS